jgi:hypothetical protein
MSPRRRRRLRLGGSLALVAIAVLAVILVPKITKEKNERAARERRQAAAADARLAARLRRSVRPRHGAAPAAERGQRGLVVIALQTAITQDMHARVRRHELDQPVRGTVCELFGRHSLAGVERGPADAGLDCTAVTDRIPSTGQAPAGLLGYPVWARVDFRTGRWAFCLIVRPAGEKGVGSNINDVRIPAPCDASKM